MTENFTYCEKTQIAKPNQTKTNQPMKQQKKTTHKTKKQTKPPTNLVTNKFFKKTQKR